MHKKKKCLCRKSHAGPWKARQSSRRLAGMFCAAKGVKALGENAKSAVRHTLQKTSMKKKMLRISDARGKAGLRQEDGKKPRNAHTRLYTMWHIGSAYCLLSRRGDDIRKYSASWALNLVRLVWRNRKVANEPHARLYKSNLCLLDVARCIFRKIEEK